MGRKQSEVWAGGQGGFAHTEKPTLTASGADAPMTAHMSSSTSQSRHSQALGNLMLMSL